jgi:anti-sigma regulatory factor (Ser/Thr protein kinase)
MAVTRPRGHGHELLLHRDAVELEAGVAAFARRALGEGRRTLLVLLPATADAVREGLGADRDRVTFADATALDRRPGPVFHAVAAFLAAEGPPAIVREVELHGMRPAARDAHLRFDAAANLLHARYGVAAMCACDAARTPEPLVHDARCVHPLVIEGGVVRESREFTDPRRFVRRPAPDGAPPRARRVVALASDRDLTGLREALRELAGASRRPHEPLDEFLLAAGEVAVNALVHGTGPRRAVVGVDDGDLVCAVRDAGPGMRDPLQGYLPPRATGAGGRGLWLASGLCDVLRVSDAAGGTEVVLRRALADLRPPGTR